MYRNEFDNKLKQNEVFNAYMFYGQSSFLIEYYTNLVANQLGNKDEIEKLYFDDYNFKYAKDKLLQSSLFSSNNILIIKIDKKLPKKDVTELLEACSINPDSKVIFACMGDSDFKAMDGYFTPKLNAVSVRFFSPFANEAVKLIETHARKLNLNYEISALNHLYFMHRQDLSLCVNDLEKLAILNEKITTDKVNAHCFGIGAVNFEEFLHNLLSSEDISDDLELLLEEGMNEIYLLTQVTSFVQQLFMISSYARVHGVPNAKEILGFVPPKNVWEKKTRLAINIKPEKFLEILNYLLSIELELKSSKIHDSNLYLQACLRKVSVLIR
ncbi:DNA polymerase III subunit delta [Halarcobacter bivalviorum]|uniref:DNA polymerase III subunit delta n=1 Tax=Halarcobacter bivalviorum TaxID=663364 RepID=A0AAX2A9T4_9BACT|nr:DNA polymerase III subunit delta [Halarcobacter bivalviorum]AXH13301.1 DNA polymerase III, delta subunit [Halarcobacter bivalviorum]RXK10093.1 DNA polymerase III subunit delta [Halarcobacter bivalviorum]